jgi:hypothetical protein
VRTKQELQIEAGNVFHCEQACSFHCQPANSGSVFVELIYYIFIQAKTQVSRENTKNFTLKREEKILFTVKIPKFLPLKYQNFFTVY